VPARSSRPFARPANAREARQGRGENDRRRGERGIGEMFISRSARLDGCVVVLCVRDSFNFEDQVAQGLLDELQPLIE
jgi:hypothetical protein